MRAGKRIVMLQTILIILQIVIIVLSLTTSISSVFIYTSIIILLILHITVGLLIYNVSRISNSELDRLVELFFDNDSK